MKNNTLALILSAIALAICAGLFASANPDGLEKVSRVLKFAHRSKINPGLFTHYMVYEIKHPTLSAVLAGIFGIILIIFVFHSIIHLKHLIDLLLRLMKAEKKNDDVE
jgi:hypothetical protein